MSPHVWSPNHGIQGTRADPLTSFLLMQRYLLFQRRDMPVYPTNETVAQVFARLSAYRDAMDGPQVCSSNIYGSFLLGCLALPDLGRQP